MGSKMHLALRFTGSLGLITGEKLKRKRKEINNGGRKGGRKE